MIRMRYSDTIESSTGWMRHNEALYRIVVAYKQTNLQCLRAPVLFLLTCY